MLVRSTASGPSHITFRDIGHLHLKPILRSSQCHLRSSTTGMAKQLWGWDGEGGEAGAPGESRVALSRSQAGMSSAAFRGLTLSLGRTHLLTTVYRTRL